MRTLKIAVLLAGLMVALTGVLGAGDAVAAVTPAPALQVTTVTEPTVMPLGIGSAGGSLHMHIVVENVGGATTTEPIKVTEAPPAGSEVTGGTYEPPGENGEEGCSVGGGGELVCELPRPLVPGGFAVVTTGLTVSGVPGESLRDVVSVSGGGAQPAQSEASIRFAAHEHETAPPGISLFSFQATGPAGEPVTQAAAHPNLLTTRLMLNNVYDESVGDPIKPVQAVKDLVFYLPVGMLGDPAVSEPCPISLIAIHFYVGACPASSRLGTIFPMLLETAHANTDDATNDPLMYSVTPEKGFAAELAFDVNDVVIVSYASVVEHDGSYLLRVAVPGIPPGGFVVGLIASFYGELTEPQVPAGQEYTLDRGAFLTDPSDCNEDAQAREASVELNTWEHPETMLSQSATAFPALEGCGLLGLAANLSAGPDVRAAGDTSQADEPSGYRLDLEVPQAPDGSGSLTRGSSAPAEGDALGTPPYKTVNFTLPAGTSLSPGAANGLTACEASGPHGIDFPAGTGKPGNPGEPAGEGEVEGPEGLPDPAQGHCPTSSIVGTVHASTPLLKEELEGHLYLAEPECGNAAHTNPCTPEDAQNGSLFRLYLELEAAQRGVIVKLAGKADVNPTTGQVTTVFENTPQFPVSNLVVETTGGPRASLANPQTCGTATTTAMVAPWSGGPAAEPSGSFEVNEGCGAQGFNPSFTAGTTDNQAGEYEPFTLTLKREDREQDIGALTTTLPEGLLAAVSHVAKCPEPQAAQGSCPEASRIGTTTVGIGSGTQPFNQTGSVYFTGPYDGAPFGLSVVVPAVAGPFNLGNVVVRAALRVNPNTTQVTAETPGVGQPGGLPQIIDGVPLRIRTINVTLNDPAFTLNPTNCSKLSITGTVTSTTGTTTNVSAPFEANGCRDLPFKPVLSASTQAKASREGGASLTVKVATTPGQANIAKVQLRLPKKLPARLATLKLACTEAQFNTNPAGCPAASNIGTATAHTPILAAPLTGPAYLVSHGSAAFPDVEFVLQGEGVTIVLDGKTQIKGGYTYSRFETVPDAPISSFETVLPEGVHSALAAVLPHNSYDMCGQALQMPTTIVAQNGAQLTQTTKIGVTGCGKAKPRKKAKAACRKKKGRARRDCEARARRRKK